MSERKATVFDSKYDNQYREAAIDTSPAPSGWKTDSTGMAGGHTVAVRNGDTWHQYHGNGTSSPRPNWTDEHAAGHAQEMQRIANIFSDRSTDKRAGVKGLPRPTGTVGKYAH